MMSKEKIKWKQYTVDYVGKDNKKNTNWRNRCVYLKTGAYVYAETAIDNKIITGSENVSAYWIMKDSQCGGIENLK